jgi:hypothetical protein
MLCDDLTTDACSCRSLTICRTYYRRSLRSGASPRNKKAPPPHVQLSAQPRQPSFHHQHNTSSPFYDHSCDHPPLNEPPIPREKDEPSHAAAPHGCAKSSDSRSARTAGSKCQYGTKTTSRVHPRGLCRPGLCARCCEGYVYLRQHSFLLRRRRRGRDGLRRLGFRTPPLTLLRSNPPHNLLPPLLYLDIASHARPP